MVRFMTHQQILGRCSVARMSVLCSPMITKVNLHPEISWENAFPTGSSNVEQVSGERITTAGFMVGRTSLFSRPDLVVHSIGTTQQEMAQL